jgi:RES domain-containing protein
VSELPELGRVWRVGLATDPLGFVPAERRAYNNRFDDVDRRFGTLYCALVAETALREVLADLRPNAAAIARYVTHFGPQATADLPPATVTAQWRRRHVLAPARLDVDGPVLDLTDIDQRRQIEQRHAELLADHGMSHLDLHEVTTRRRIVTQTIAADAFDQRAAAAIRFASRLDGLPCYALFEGRGGLASDGEPIQLTDPAPEALQNVAASWQMTIEPTATIAVRHPS